MKSRGARKRFLDLPWRLYGEDPLWVPPLRSEMKKMFASKPAFFLNADMALFLAERGGRPVGRVAAIHNKGHNQQYGDKTGFFGFFECEDDSETAKGLVKAAEAALAAAEYSKIPEFRGHDPNSLSNSGSCPRNSCPPELKKARRALDKADADPVRPTAGNILRAYARGRLEPGGR